MPLCEPTQVVVPVRAPPSATGEQIDAASADGASKPMPNDIAAPKTIGSKTIRARERLTLDELLRSALRRVSSTERRSIFITPKMAQPRCRAGAVDGNS